MFDDTEPSWCEDCEYFTDVGLNGEGRCAVRNAGTWYGQIACEKFKEEREDD